MVAHFVRVTTPDAMTIRSSFPDVIVPDVSLADYVFERAGEWPDRPALIDGPSGRVLTYGALGALIDRVAGALASRGFGRGDVLCIYSPNVPEYAAVFFGVARAGGTNTTANPLYGAEELAKQLRDSGAKIVVTIPMLAERAREATTAAGGAEVIVFGEARGCTSFAAFVAGFHEATDSQPPVVAPARDVVALPYSSGTTGLPKGVMLTHRNLVANLAQCEMFEGTEPGDHLVGVLPFYHIYGMVVVLCLTLRRGACVVTMPQFDLEQYLRLSQRYRVRRAYLVPPIALALARHPQVDQFDLTSLRWITSGAAPMGAELEQGAAPAGSVV